MSTVVPFSGVTSQGNRAAAIKLEGEGTEPLPTTATCTPALLLSYTLANKSLFLDTVARAGLQGDLMLERRAALPFRPHTASHGLTRPHTASHGLTRSWARPSPGSSSGTPESRGSGTDEPRRVPIHTQPLPFLDLAKRWT